MLTRLNCGDHFEVYTNIEALCCIPGNNIMLFVNYVLNLCAFLFEIY